MGRREGRHHQGNGGRPNHQRRARHIHADSSRHPCGDRPLGSRRTDTHQAALARHLMRMDRQADTLCLGVALRHHAEAHSEVDQQRLQRAWSERTARPLRVGLQCEHQDIQRLATHHHRLARRQARCRRHPPARASHPLSEARAGILAPPRRRCHLHGRHHPAAGEPRARGARGLRDQRQHCRERRGGNPIHALHQRFQPAVQPVKRHDHF